MQDRQEYPDEAIALGGTVTGEHGVGLLKMRGIDKELGPAVLGMHHAVKAALDPHGILESRKGAGLGARLSGVTAGGPVGRGLLSVGRRTLAGGAYG